MNHQQAREAYSLNMDGLLGQGELVQMEAHLAECSECRTFCAELSSSAKALRGLSEIPPVPAGLLEKASAKITGMGPLAKSLLNLKGITEAFAMPAYGLPQKQVPVFASKTFAVPQLPSVVFQDILAIEQVLRSIATIILPASFEDVFGQEADRYFATVPLESTSLTEEIKKALSGRHRRLTKVTSLKVSGRAGETTSGLLSAVSGARLTGEEEIALNEENKDRAAIIRLHAAQLSRKLRKPEDLIGQELARLYGSAFIELSQKGSWVQSGDGSWRQLR